MLRTVLSVIVLVLAAAVLGDAARAVDNPPSPGPSLCRVGTGGPPGLRPCPGTKSRPGTPRPPQPPAASAGATGRVDPFMVRRLVENAVVNALEERSVPRISWLPVPAHTISLSDGRYGVWSLTASGLPTQCGRACLRAPYMSYQPGFGWSAYYRLEPRFRLKIFSYRSSPPVLQTTLTVTVPVSVRTRCLGWETGEGRVNVLSNQLQATFTRQSGLLEQIGNYFNSGLTASINAEIQQGLNGAIGGLGTARDITFPVATAQTCRSLGVVRGATAEDDEIVFDV